MKTIARTVVCVLFLLWVTTPRASAEVTSFTVNIVVSNEDGHAIDGLLACLVLDGKRVVDGPTDADGRVTLTHDVTLEPNDAGVQFCFAAPSTVNSSQQLTLSKRLQDVKLRYHLPYVVPIQLEPNKLVYDVDIKATTAVEVRAMVLDEIGKPQRADLRGPPETLPGSVERGRIIPLRGLAKGANADIAIVSYVSWPAVVVKIVHLKESQTKENVDLGTITIPSLGPGVPIRASIRGSDQMHKADLISYWDGVTFVRSDGELIVSYRAFKRGDSDALELEKPKTGDASLPEGSYFMAPGWFANNSDQLLLLKLLSSGVDLNSTSLTSVKIEGSEKDLQIDLNELHHEIVQVAAARNMQR